MNHLLKLYLQETANVEYVENVRTLIHIHIILTLSRIYDASVTVTYFLFFIFVYFFKAEKSMLLFFSFFIVVKTRIYHWQDN